VVICCVKFQFHRRLNPQQTSPDPLSPTFPRLHSLTRRSQQSAITPQPLTPCFHTLTNCPSPNSHPLLLIQMPRGATGPRISMRDTLLPRKDPPFVTPLSATLTASSAVSPLLATLTKTPGCTPSDPSLTFTLQSAHPPICKSPRLQTCNLPRPAALPSPIPSGHCRTGHTVPELPPWRKQFRPSRCLSH
jgi:hypothetical protein